MFAQANSEHCRHKIFNAAFTIDGVAQSHSLFGKTANPTSANLINVSPIKLVRANASKRSASRANAPKSANKANVQSAANGPSGPIVMIAATAMSRATRTNRAVIP
jgi:phosphoribosylformylglycinamidine (FGAM) synthase-like enzyme